MAIKIDDLAVLMDDWQRDARLDDVDVDRASLDVAVLHSRYLRRLAIARPALRKMEMRRRRLVGMLHRYYRGDMNEDREGLETLGRQPYPRKIIQTQVASYVDGDSMVLKIDDAISIHKEYVDSCMEILKQINNRQWALRNVIEFRKATGFADMSS